MNREKMSYKGFYAEIMEAPRLVDSGVHGLPSGKSIDVYHVDEFLEPKGNWMKGPGAFVVPVRPNKGLWFDWRGNDELNTAVVPTVKGCNPITGLQTSGFHLEQYESKCPKHGCNFISERFCPECDYKWPDRNYCSQHPLWWDGFRAGEFVRQFFFTPDQNLDIAPKLIGKENTIPAFGFAFYSPKEIRKVNDQSRGITVPCCDGMTYDLSDNILYSSSGASSVLGYNTPSATSLSKEAPILPDKQEDITIGLGSSKSASPSSSESALLKGGPISPSSKSASYNSPRSCSFNAPSKSANTRKGADPTLFPMGVLRKRTRSSSASAPVSKNRRKKMGEVSIGAGAKIKQSLNRDPYPLESWKEVPDAVMTIYFIFEEEFKELRAKGMRDLKGKSEGMLSSLPVG